MRFPNGITVFPAKSLIMIPAIIYQADPAQMIKIIAAAVVAEGAPKCATSSKMNPTNKDANVTVIAV